jgi:hypothetical protein
MLGACFHLTTQEGRPVLRAAPVPDGCAHRAESARRQWPPVVAAPRGLAPSYHCSERHWGSYRPLCFSPPTLWSRSSLLCSAPATASPTVAHHQWGSPELSDQAKRSVSSPRPSCTKSLPAAPASEAGPQDFPRRHLPPWATHRTAAFFDCSPTPLTPQWVLRRQGAPPQPLLRPPRPLLRQLTCASAPSARAPS